MRAAEPTRCATCLGELVSRTGFWRHWIEPADGHPVVLTVQRQELVK